MWLDIQDEIACATFGDDRLQGLGVAVGRISHFHVAWLKSWLASSPLQHSRTTVRMCDQTRNDPNGLGLRFSNVLDLPTCATWWALQAQTDHLHFVYFFHTDRRTDRYCL